MVFRPELRHKFTGKTVQLFGQSWLYRFAAPNVLEARTVTALSHPNILSMLSHRVRYNELGDLYLGKLNKHHLTRNLLHRLERLGYTFKLEQKAA